MKKYFLSIVLVFCVLAVNAQLVNQASQSQKKQSDLDWYNCSFEQDRCV